MRLDWHLVFAVGLLGWRCGSAEVLAAAIDSGGFWGAGFDDRNAGDFGVIKLVVGAKSVPRRFDRYRAFYVVS